MKTYFRIAVILLLCCALINCTNDSNSPSPNLEDMGIALSLTEAAENGYNLTRIKVTITKGDFSDYTNLSIDSTQATGTFEALEPGVYEIDVKAYENEELVAFGAGTGEVIAGETTTVTITIQFLPRTGGLEIIVNWVFPEIDPPERILFVGNSHTYYNGGIYAHLQNLVLDSDSSVVIFCDGQTYGGYSLEDHWNNSSTIAAIQDNEWDMVVLQEQSYRPVGEPELFYQYATLLDSVITESGAQTVFFMTWRYEGEEYTEMIEDLAAAYNHIGQLLDAPVIPAGRAWQMAEDQDSHIEFYMGDGNHANYLGTYLTVCTFYAALWHRSPVGIEYVNDGLITDNEREFLQTVAWDTVVMYGPR